MKANLTYYKKIFSDVAKRDIVSLYLLEGPEHFIMEEMASRITASIIPDDLRTWNLTTAYGGEVDLGEFLATASSFPFLSDSRVLVLKEMEKLRGSWKPLISYCESPLPSSILIMLFNPFEEGRGRSRAPRDLGKLEAAVRARGKIIAVDRLGPEDLEVWVRQKGRRFGVELTSAAALALLRSVGENLFDLQNELAKIGLLHEGETVDVRDLEGTIGSYRIDAVFALIEGIRPGNEAAVLRSLTRILRTGAERPPSIVYLLVRHFLGALKARVGLPVAGYGAEHCRRRAGEMREREILVWLENLRRVELALKSSSIPEEPLLACAIVHSMRGLLMEAPAGIEARAA